MLFLKSGCVLISRALKRQWSYHCSNSLFSAFFLHADATDVLEATHICVVCCKKKKSSLMDNDINLYQKKVSICFAVVEEGQTNLCWTSGRLPDLNIWFGFWQRQESQIEIRSQLNYKGQIRFDNFNVDFSLIQNCILVKDLHRLQVGEKYPLSTVLAKACRNWTN